MSKKNQNTFEKRRRDMEKKLRAEEKRKKRQKKKDGSDFKTSLDSGSSDVASAVNVTNDPSGA